MCVRYTEKKRVRDEEREREKVMLKGEKWVKAGDCLRPVSGMCHWIQASGPLAESRTNDSSNLTSLKRKGHAIQTE